MKLQSGALEEADEYLARALRLYDSGGARQGRAQALYWQSMLRIQQKRVSEAGSGFQLALRISRDLGDRPGEAMCLRGLGQCQQERGERGEAKATMLAALHIVQQPRPTAMETHIRASLSALD